MHVQIYNPKSGTVEMDRALGDHEILNCRDFAREWCDMMDMQLSNDDGIVPYGCADFDVIIYDPLTHNPDNGVCWDCESFFFEGLE